MGRLVRLRQVTLHMQSQVIRTSKAALADLTLEWLGPSVLSVMASQLVRAGETPLTLGPLASIGFLACGIKQMTG